MVTDSLRLSAQNSLSSVLSESKENELQPVLNNKVCSGTTDSQYSFMQRVMGNCLCVNVLCGSS